MVRKIIKIDEEKCNGCGLCVNACHEGALEMVDGKARLVSESYCDGLGDCLPACPTNAIIIETREAAEFDEAAVKERMKQRASGSAASTTTGDGSGVDEAGQSGPQLSCGCPGSQARVLNKNTSDRGNTAITNAGATYESAATRSEAQLAQWPCQIKLVPVNAPYFDNAHLLVAADCTAYAYANIHNDFMKGKVTIIGCPKLDSVDYSEKLSQILASHNIKSITVLRMEVPCCGGIVNAVKDALINSGKMIPWSIVTISTDGQILDV